MAEFNCPDVTLCGWQGIKIKFLAYSLCLSGYTFLRPLTMFKTSWCRFVCVYISFDLWRCSWCNMLLDTVHPHVLLVVLCTPWSLYLLAPALTVVGWAPRIKVYKQMFERKSTSHLTLWLHWSGVANWTIFLCSLFNKRLWYFYLGFLCVCVCECVCVCKFFCLFFVAWGGLWAWAQH